MNTHEQPITQTDLMIAEYNVLESVREKASSERASRGNFFLAIAYGSFLALGALTTSSLPSDSRAAVALVIVVTLVIVGLSSFNQSAISNYRVIWYTHGLNRIRCYFVQIEPDIKKYYILPTNGEFPPFRVAVGDICQLIAVINSALVFVLTAGALLMFAPYPIYLVVILSGLVSLISYLGHLLRLAHLAQKFAQETMTDLPSPTAAAGESEPPRVLPGGSVDENEQVGNSVKPRRRKSSPTLLGSNPQRR